MPKACRVHWFIDFLPCPSWRSMVSAFCGEFTDNGVCSDHERNTVDTHVRIDNTLDEIKKKIKKIFPVIKFYLNPYDHITIK